MCLMYQITTWLWQLYQVTIDHYHKRNQQLHCNGAELQPTCWNFLSKKYPAVAPDQTSRLLSRAHTQTLKSDTELIGIIQTHDTPLWGSTSWFPVVASKSKHESNQTTSNNKQSAKPTTRPCPTSFTDVTQVFVSVHVTTCTSGALLDSQLCKSK